MVINTTHYTRFSIRSKFTVTSFKDRDVRLIVRRKVVGTVDKASEGAKITAFNPQEEGPDEAYSWWWGWWPGWLGVNTFAQVSWETTLKKGETATFEYDWHYHGIP
jgi:hypothetical protein